MTRIQIITIFINLLFLFYISKLIIKGKLREEYSIIWLICTIAMLVFSFWAKGLDVLSELFGIQVPANLVFTGFIFVILIYLLHLSVVNSRLQRHVTKITQELALMKERLGQRSEETNDFTK